MNPLYALCRCAKALGYARRSPPARAMADDASKDHTPSAMQGEARLRGLWRIISSKTIISVTAWDARCSLRLSKRPLPVERRPKFISVTAWDARCSLRLSEECSTLLEWCHATRSTIFAARVAPASNSSNAAGPAASGRSSSQSPSSETRPSASSASARAKSASL